MREIPQQLERRLVGEVAVLDAQQQRPVVSQLAQEGREGSSEQAQTVRLTTGRIVGEIEVVAQLRDDIRQVDRAPAQLLAQPVWRLGDEIIDQRVLERTQHGGAALLVAGAGEAEEPGLLGTPDERANQRTLTGAGRRAKEHQLAAGAGAVEGAHQLSQLGASINKLRRRREWVGTREHAPRWGGNSPPHSQTRRRDHVTLWLIDVEGREVGGQPRRDKLEDVLRPAQAS